MKITVHATNDSGRSALCDFMAGKPWGHWPDDHKYMTLESYGCHDGFTQEAVECLGHDAHACPECVTEAAKLEPKESPEPGPPEVVHIPQGAPFAKGAAYLQGWNECIDMVSKHLEEAATDAEAADELAGRELPGKEALAIAWLQGVVKSWQGQTKQ